MIFAAPIVTSRGSPWFDFGVWKCCRFAADRAGTSSAFWINDEQTLIYLISSHQAQTVLPGFGEQPTP